MTIETWFLFFIAYLVVTLSPGPNVLLVVKNAVKHGYKIAGMTILMNLICQLLIITLVAFGAGALLLQSPLLFFTLKLMGGVYLIYLGMAGFMAKKREIQVVTEPFSLPFSYVNIAKEAFFVSASNPKTIIFLSAFLPQFISPDTPIGLQFMIILLTICLIVASVHLTYSYLAKSINNKWRDLKTKPILSNITNSAFILFGCGVLSSSRTISI